MQKLPPICKIIAHLPGNEGCGRIPGEKAHQTPPHPMYTGGLKCPPKPRGSLVRLTEDLPKDSKRRGEMAALYSRRQGRSRALRGWMATVATYQINRHTKLLLQGKGYATPTAATILT